MPVPGDRRASGECHGATSVASSMSMLATRLHSRRVRDADRPEPGLHQLDRPDRPRAWRLRGRRLAPPSDRGDPRLPRVRDGLRGRVRHAGVAQRRGAARGHSALARSCPTRRWDCPAARPSAFFSVAALLALVARRRSSAWADGLEVVALAAGAAALVFGALGWGGTPAGAAALLVQLAVLSAATGGVFAAMILGPLVPRDAASCPRRRSSCCRGSCSRSWPSRSRCSWPGSDSAPGRPSVRRSAR